MRSFSYRLTPFYLSSRLFSRLPMYAAGLVFALFYLSACINDTEPEPAPTVLVTSNVKSNYSATQLKALAEFAGYPDLADYVKSGIRVFNVVYNTELEGKPITASGVIVVPRDVAGPYPILLAQRGTIFKDSEAPTLANPFYGFEVLAAAGYIVVLADMIGFGESDDQIHPYYNKEASYRPVVDLLRAAVEFMKNENLAQSEKCFLFGYSQGGYVTLATLQEMERLNPLGYPITAAAAGAGGYQINAVMNDVRQRVTYTAPSFLANVLYSYNYYEGWNRPMSDFFKAPYAERIAGLLDGSKTQNEIDAQLTNNVADLFQPSFLAGLANGTETQVINAFNNNSVHNWRPSTPLRLYHSTGDQYIPISDSQNTTNTMKGLGANVDFKQAGTQPHGPAAFDMMLDVLPWFNSLK